MLICMLYVGLYMVTRFYCTHSAALNVKSEGGQYCYNPQCRLVCHMTHSLIPWYHPRPCGLYPSKWWHNILGVCVLLKAPRFRYCMQPPSVRISMYFHSVCSSALHCSVKVVCVKFERFKSPTTAVYMMEIIWKNSILHPLGFEPRMCTPTTVTNLQVSCKLLWMSLKDFPPFPLYHVHCYIYTCISWRLPSSSNFYRYHIQDGCAWLWGRLMVIG